MSKERKRKENGAVTIRYVDDEIDEIYTEGASIHIEQMTADGWYIGIDAKDGSYWQFWLGAKNRRSAVEVRHTETSPPDPVSVPDGSYDASHAMAGKQGAVG